MGTAKALFTNGSNTVICTSGPSGYPSYWTKQLLVGDSIRPFDSTRFYEIQSITDDSTLSFTLNYNGNTGIKTFSMLSNFPLYDDDGHTGAKIVGSKTDGFGINNGDHLILTVDSSYQNYVFSGDVNNGSLIASLITGGFNGVNATYGWVTDLSAPYGYRETLILKTNGLHNKLVIHNDSSGTALKLGFIPDTTSIGNNNSVDRSSEYAAILQEQTDLGYASSNEYLALSTLLGETNKLNRNPTDVTSVFNYCLDEFNQIIIEMDRLNVQILSLNKLLLEPSAVSYSDTSTALFNAYAALSDCSSALLTDYASLLSINTRGAMGWALNLSNDIQYITPFSDNNFSLYIDSTKSFVDATISTVYYSPVAYFFDTSLPIDGTFNGSWYPSLTGDRYTTDSTLTFIITDRNDFLILNRTDAVSHSYFTDNVRLIIDSTDFYYNAYPTVGAMKTAINSTVLGISASGNAIYNSVASGFQGSGLIAPDATLHPGLRSCYVDYWTIEDNILWDRLDYVTNRYNIISNRLAYLITRKNQIKSAILSEEYLRAIDGDTGNIYNWADNRFNRSNGCEARLKQIEKQIQMNQSGLKVSKRLF
jgi:hypothetical protein